MRAVGGVAAAPRSARYAPRALPGTATRGARPGSRQDGVPARPKEGPRPAARGPLRAARGAAHRPRDYGSSSVLFEFGREVPICSEAAWIEVPVPEASPAALVLVVSV